MRAMPLPPLVSHGLLLDARAASGIKSKKYNRAEKSKCKLELIILLISQCKMREDKLELASTSVSHST